jgi:hypothetical protein
MPLDKKFHEKHAELLNRLIGEPSEDELRQLQLHVDVLEKWRLLGETHDHTDRNNDNTHDHNDHSS